MDDPDVSPKMSQIKGLMNRKLTQSGCMTELNYLVLKLDSITTEASTGSLSCLGGGGGCFNYKMTVHH